MIVTSRPSLRTQTHLSQTCELSKLDACGAAAKGVGVPVFEEYAGVRIHEACEPPNGIGGTVRAMVVMPTGHLALVFVATHVRGDAEDGLVDVAVAETTSPVRWAVLDLVARLQLEAFVTECWVPDRCLFIRVVKGDVIFIGRALGSTDGRHAAATGRGTSGRLRVNVVKNASGEPRMYETAMGLEQCVVVHSDVLFQGLETCVVCGTSGSLRTESHDFRCDPGVVDGVDVLVHKFFQAGLGV